MRPAEFNTDAIRGFDCYKEAWELIKGQYWMVFAVVLVGMIVGSLIPLILLGPMMIGIYMCLFDAVEGKAISFDKLFKGFDLFLPSLVLSAVIMVPVFVMLIVFYVPMIAMAIAGQRMSESEVFAFLGVTIAVELVIAVIMVCLHTLVMFSYPLMADRRLGAWGAIKTSAAAVRANLKGVVGLMVAGFVAVLLGYMALCVGVYLVIPLILAANTVAYRKVFPSRREPDLAAPPPPYAYQDI